MQYRRRLELILATLILVTTACATGANSEPTSQAASPTTTQASAMTSGVADAASTSYLLTPFSFEIPEGWSVTRDEPGSFNLESEAFPSGLVAVIPDWAIATQENCSHGAEANMGRTVQDLVEWLTQHPGLITSTPEAITLGGLEGQVLDIRKDPEWSGPCPGRVDLFTHRGTINDGGGWDINDSMRFRLYILDAGDGHTATVHVETMDEESFEDFVEAATPILSAFTFLSDIGTVTITDSECVAEVETALTPGQLMFTVSNETTTAAAAEVFRLKEGHGFEVIEAHVKDERERADAGQGWAGPPLGQADFVSQGSGIMDADESKVVVFDGAEPGTYAIMCFRHHPNASGPVRLFASIGPLEVQP